MDDNADWCRELLGLNDDDIDSEAFTSLFICPLIESGPSGVYQVITDAPSSLIITILELLHDSRWQLCHDHFAWYLLHRLP